MGKGGFLFFGDEDNILIEEIAKLHKVDKAIVKEHYHNMLEAIGDETQNEDKA